MSSLSRRNAIAPIVKRKRAVGAWAHATQGAGTFVAERVSEHATQGGGSF